MTCTPRRPYRPYDDGEPSPSSPYYLFGIQKRYPFQWSGAAGGVLPPARARGGLGNADLYESGYGDPMYRPYPALQRTILHRSLGDWPLVRPAGPELWVSLGMSDTEKQYALIAAAGLAAWWLFFRKGKRRTRRRNPSARGGYYVASSTRGVSGRLFFKKKLDAKWYAKLLRSQGKSARVIRA